MAEVKETKNTIETPETKPKAKTKAQLLAEKMEQKRVAQTAFDAGAKPIIDTNPPANEPEKPQEAPKDDEPTKDTPEVTEAPEKAQKATETAQTAPKTKKTTKDTTKAKNATTGEKTAKEEKPASSVKILDKISKPKREKKAGRNYYLSVKNMEKLAELAEQNDRSPSDMLDEILTAVFSE